MSARIAPWPFGALKMFGYGMIMADPPWSFDHWSEKGATDKSAGGQYSVMTLEAIKALPVGELATRDAILWLWATHPMLREGLDVMAAWGFRFVTSGVWVKRTATGKLAFGTGYRLRCASEPFLIGVVGNPETPRNIRTVIEGPLRKHSQKPEAAYEAAERMTPPGGFRADLFARQRREGWDGFGDEIDKFKQEKAA